MIHFLRDKDNNTISAIEVYQGTDEDGNDTGIVLNSSIDLQQYSKVFLDTMDSDNQELIQTYILVFDTITGLRYDWEMFFAESADLDKLEDEIGVFHKNITRVLDKLDIRYIVD